MTVTETPQPRTETPRAVTAVADPEQAQRASEANASLVLLGSVLLVVAGTEGLVALLRMFA